MSNETDRWGEDRGAPLVRPPKQRWPGVLLVGSMLMLSAVIVFPAAHSLYGVFNPRARYAKVVGRVTYKGEPLPSGTITFLGARGSQPATGEINYDGTYEVVAPTGDVRICVTVKPIPRRGSVTASTTTGGLTRCEYPAIMIPSKYADPGKSGLRFTIKKGTNQIDIDLTD